MIALDHTGFILTDISRLKQTQHLVNRILTKTHSKSFVIVICWSVDDIQLEQEVERRSAHTFLCYQSMVVCASMGAAID